MNNKFDENAKKEIIQLYKNGEDVASLAVKFSTTKSTITKIVNGKTKKAEKSLNINSIQYMQERMRKLQDEMDRKCDEYVTDLGKYVYDKLGIVDIRKYTFITIDEYEELLLIKDEYKNLVKTNSETTDTKGDDTLDNTEGSDVIYDETEVDTPADDTVNDEDDEDYNEVESEYTDTDNIGTRNGAW